jgi:hypothetical protein
MKYGRLLGVVHGTSAAAPLVTRIASAIKARYSDFSSILIRALVLLSAQPTSFEPMLVKATPAARAEASRRLAGFGQPAIVRAIESTSHQVVLIAESHISMNGVHIYELPISSLNSRWMRTRPHLR